MEYVPDDLELPAWQAVTGLPRGDSERCHFRINRVLLESGDALTLPATGVTAIVGANNTGKSTLLRQLQWHLTQPQNLVNERVRLIAEVTSARDGDVQDLLAWLDRHTTYRAAQPHEGARGTFARPGSAVALDEAMQRWQGDPAQPLGPALGTVLVSYADAQSRLDLVGTVAQRGDVGEPPQHPLHLLQDDADLRHRLNDLSRRIFGQELTLDHLSGNMQLRVGVPPAAPPAADEGQRAYRRALAELPPLQLQGDGMKSLLGLLLPLVAATYPVIIVDEPEAFLHPPQAHALGKALGQLATERDVQVILATHDRNLLAGLLDSGSPLSVVRLERQEISTCARQLPAVELRELWSDPVLRYSNVLDGLFHRLVVLAEADRDCRFYEAATDHSTSLGDSEVVTPASDVLFVPSYGKAAMARLATALVALGVRVVASPDLDVLNDSTVLRSLVTAVGGDWGTLARDYQLATEDFRQPREATKVRHVRDSLQRLFNEVLSEDDDRPYLPAIKEKVLAEVRARESPWQALKTYGDRAFRGEGAVAATRLLDALDAVGVVTVRVGELEGFAPALGVAKGREWLGAALHAGAHMNADVQAHVARLLRHAA